MQTGIKGIKGGNKMTDHSEYYEDTTNDYCEICGRIITDCEHP